MAGNLRKSGSENKIGSLWLRKRGILVFCLWNYRSLALRLNQTVRALFFWLKMRQISLFSTQFTSNQPLIILKNFNWNRYHTKLGKHYLKKTFFPLFFSDSALQTLKSVPSPESAIFRSKWSSFCGFSWNRQTTRKNPPLWPFLHKIWQKLAQNARSFAVFMAQKH